MTRGLQCAAGIVAFGALWIASSPPALAQARRPRAVTFAPDLQIGGEPGSGVGVQQEEPTIAADPANPDRLVAVSHDFFESPLGLPCVFSNSLDGGRTWTVRGHVGSAESTRIDFCSDPDLTADTQGNFYLGYISGSFRSGGPMRDGVAVTKSTDGGMTFAPPALTFRNSASLTADKEALAADDRPLSPFRDTIYMTFSLIDDRAATTVAVVQVSRDGGLSWSEPLPISAVAHGTIQEEFLWGSLPLVAPDGAVYVFYLFAEPPLQRSRISFVKSTDGGRTWSAPADMASNLPTPGFGFEWDEGDPSTTFGIRGNSAPAAAITPGGAIFVAWADFPDGFCDPVTLLCVNSDIRMSVSSDGGASWSAPIKITDDTGSTDQFFPSMAAHPDGLVSVVWLDRRLDPNNVLYDLFYTNTADGRLFLSNVRVSAASSDPSNGSFIGDYIQMAATAAGVVPVWPDMRDAVSPHIFTALGTMRRR